MKTLAGLLILASAGWSATITLDATNTGWWARYTACCGYHATGSGQNYFAGFQSGLNYNFNDYFIFDLTGISGITSATLSLANPSNGYDSPNASETYSLFDTSTSPAALAAYDGGSVAGLAIWQDLGSGVQYGTQTVSAADDGKQVQITLDAQALTALNSANGLFAIGGSLTSAPLSGNSTVAIFSSSTFSGPAARQLILTTSGTSATPEPATAGSFILGGGLILIIRERSLTAAAGVRVSSFSNRGQL